MLICRKLQAAVCSVSSENVNRLQYYVTLMSLPSIVLVFFFTNGYSNNPFVLRAMTAAWELRLLVARNHLARGGVIVLAGQLNRHQVVGLPFHSGA